MTTDDEKHVYNIPEKLDRQTDGRTEGQKDKQVNERINADIKEFCKTSRTVVGIFLYKL